MVSNETTVADPAASKRTFGAMPGRGKAAVLVIWITCALAALPLVIGMSGVLSQGLDRPGNMMYAGLFLLLAVYGGFLITLSILLIKGKNWARIALIVLYAISIATFLLSLFTQALSGSDIRNLMVAVPMLFLLMAEPVREWCSSWADPAATAAAASRPSRY